MTTNLEAKADIARLITIAKRQSEMLEGLHTLLAAERAGSPTLAPTSA
jgi:hypothetical protein